MNIKNTYKIIHTNKNVKITWVLTMSLKRVTHIKITTYYNNQDKYVKLTI